MSDKDLMRVTYRLRIEKAMHTLEGILEGITADGKASNKEMQNLTTWIKNHEEFQHLHPFNEVIPRILKIVKDKIFDEEQRADLLWLSKRFTTRNDYFNEVDSDIHRLQGILHGILADNKITKKELDSLNDWIEAREHLKGTWPYDQIESLVWDVIKDGKIDEDEHGRLVAFFEEFIINENGKSVDPTYVSNRFSRQGICVLDPDVIFKDKMFVFSGNFTSGHTKEELWEIVTERGGIFKKNLVKSTNYLIIGGEGNPCWAMACYGRKIEKANNWNRQGASITLVQEQDFFDATYD